MNKDYSGIMLRTPSDIDAFAKSIGWFTKEPSEYTGEGKLATRKAPPRSPVSTQRVLL